MASILLSESGRGNAPQIGVWKRKSESLENSKTLHQKPAHVEIIKSAEVFKKDGTPSKMLYIHEIGTNRRLDRWVDAEEVSEIETSVLINNGNIFLDSVDFSEDNSSIMTRKMKRKNDDFNNAEFSLNELDPETRRLELEYRKKTQIKYIQRVLFGTYLLDTWYFSPYPDDYYGKAEKLYVCSYCLKYMRLAKTYDDHFFKKNCPRYNLLPGKVIYYDETNSIYVCCVDGKNDKIFCQNLNLFCKLFIDHKTVYFDIERFLFYIIYVSVNDLSDQSTQNDYLQIAGYFSKEKTSLENFNLSCFVVLPPFQRKGFGMLLISISYYLSHLEGKIQGPETPLSDLGRCSYLSYWKYFILTYLSKYKSVPSLEELSKQTGFKLNDIIMTLKTINAVQKISPSSQVAALPPNTSVHSSYSDLNLNDGSSYFISISIKDIINLVNSKEFKKPNLIFDPECICF